MKRLQLSLVTRNPNDNVKNLQVRHPPKTGLLFFGSSLYFSAALNHPAPQKHAAQQNIFHLCSAKLAARRVTMGRGNFVWATSWSNQLYLDRKCCGSACGCGSGKLAAGPERSGGFSALDIYISSCSCQHSTTHHLYKF